MTSRNKRSKSARKAVVTNQTRKTFVERFSRETLEALARIVKGRVATSTSAVRRQAAFKANLTRGTYRPFVTVRKDGSISRDVLGLSKMD